MGSSSGLNTIFNRRGPPEAMFREGLLPQEPLGFPSAEANPPKIIEDGTCPTESLFLNDLKEK